MDFLTAELDSGIRVATEPMPSVRSVALGFWFAIGSRDEGPDEAGASHFLEHLLFKGTERRTARQIAEELDAIGGDLNAFTSKEYTCFYARVLDRDLPVAADVLGDMVVNATNTADDVEAERQVVLEEINIHFDSPDDLVHSDFAHALLGDHPLALETLGTHESITGMSRDTIHDYFLTHYRPENLVVAAAGNVDHEAVVALAEGMLGDLGRPGGRASTRQRPDRYITSPVTVRTRPTEQAHVVLGGRGLEQDDDRRWALRVLNVALGGGMSSRLFQEIREERGLAYATYSYTQTHTDGGAWGAYLGTAPGRVDEALKVLVDTLDGVIDDLTVAEVERAKGSLKGGMVLGLEDTGSRMNRLGKMISTGAELITVDEAIRRTDEIDLDAVRAVARDLLARPRCLSVVGPFAADETDRFADYVA
ncbi:MAG: insulinase family protein [Actinobacteria bacterium]|nr:insulinase family protein [Actinomycetota bacterium]